MYNLDHHVRRVPYKLYMCVLSTVLRLHVLMYVLVYGTRCMYAYDACVCSACVCGACVYGACVCSACVCGACVYVVHV